MEHLTREELGEILYHARANRQRDHALFVVSFWHGLRATEAVTLTPENFRDGYINVQRLKGSMRTIQQLMEDPEELFDEKAAIDGWIVRHQQSHNGNGNAQRLFPISRIQFYRLMRHYCELAGIPEHKSHPHVLKHSIAMQSIRQAGIENVRQWLGHKSIASTGSYLRVDDEAAGRAIASAVKSRKN